MFNLSSIPVPDLSGRTILVTGSGQGIGAQLVEILVEHGAQVFAGVHGVPLANTQKLLSGAEVLKLDVTHQSDVDQAILAIKHKAGKLDVLVNNAGTIGEIGPIDQIPSETFSAAYDVNVTGLHRMTVAALGLLCASNGTIVNAGTGAATTPMEGWGAYCCSKAGVHMLTRMFELELKGKGVKNVFIGIPPTDTDMQARIRNSGLNPVSQIAQGDLVRPSVPASVMAWLCSAEAHQNKDVFLDVRDDVFKEMMRNMD